MFTGNLSNGLWIAFIGWFLESAAVSQVQRQTVHDLLAGYHVSAVMSRDYTVVSPETTLQQLVDHHILGSGQRSLMVGRDDRIIGLLTLHHIKETPRAEWPTITAAQAMIPAAQMKRVQPDAELWTALEEMDKDGVNQLPVMMDGQMIGMLSRDGIISFLRTRRELGE
jgi:predicted transcriptional regulator